MSNSNMRSPSDLSTEVGFDETTYLKKISGSLIDEKPGPVNFEFRHKLPKHNLYQCLTFIEDNTVQINKIRTVLTKQRIDNNDALKLLDLLLTDASKKTKVADSLALWLAIGGDVLLNQICTNYKFNFPCISRFNIAQQILGRALSISEN